MPFQPGHKRAGGRAKGTPNKVTGRVREVLDNVFVQLQTGTGAENGHMLAWAREHPTDFYRLWIRLLPHQVEAGIDGLDIRGWLMSLGEPD